MKKCCEKKRPDRESHVMETKHDMGKLMGGKANSHKLKEGSHKELLGMKARPMPGRKG